MKSNTGNNGIKSNCAFTHYSRAIIAFLMMAGPLEHEDQLMQELGRGNRQELPFAMIYMTQSIKSLHDTLLHEAAIM